MKFTALNFVTGVILVTISILTILWVISHFVQVLAFMLIIGLFALIPALVFDVIRHIVSHFRKT